MKFVKDLVEKSQALYHAPDSKFHKFWPAFDANETFLLTPGTTAPKHGPHVRDYNDLKRVMSQVIIALIPCLLFAIYNTGYQHFHAVAGMVADGGAGFEYQLGWLQGLLMGGDYATQVAGGAFEASWWDNAVFGLQRMLPIIIVSYGVGLSIEVGFAIWRQEEVSEGYLVSGMLIPLIVPASIPLWQLALGVAFTVILCKEIFGGTGMNIFNIALMARAFLFFAYPGQMSGDAVWVAGNDSGPAGTAIIDGYSSPTALAAAAQSQLAGNHVGAVAGEGGYYVSAVDAVQSQLDVTWWDAFVGLIPGSAGETSALACLIGAVILLITGVASWRTMFGGIIGLAGMVFVINGFAGGLDGIGGYPVQWHMVTGGFAFGLVFMATDPVTAPETNRGKWIYGILIGVLTVLVRCVNPAYPEGVMLAILLMNAFAPTIDYFVVQANIRRRKLRLG